MSDDLHHRIAAAVRTIADAPPVSPPPLESLRHPDRTPRGRRWAPALVAAAVLALVAGIALVPVGGGTDRRPADPAGPPATLPARFADPSWLTASVSDAPPGPAIALYQQQTGDSRDPTTARQVIVVGTDGHTYRRVISAEDPTSKEPPGDWGVSNSLLSPDGTRVAVGHLRRHTNGLEVVDLRTGKARTYGGLNPPAMSSPIAWSPDGRRLVILVSNDESLDEVTAVGVAMLLDLSTGALTKLAGPFSARVVFEPPLEGPPCDPAVAFGPCSDIMKTRTATFSPDGTLIALCPGTAEAKGIKVLDLSGTVRRTVAAPSSSCGALRWSPDGTQLVATQRDAHLVFLDATGQERAVPAPLYLSDNNTDSSSLGWRSPTELLIGIRGGDGYRIVGLPVDGSAPHTISLIPNDTNETGDTNRVSGVQLSADLTATAQVRDVSDIERGPWPWWWRMTLAGLTLILAGLALILTNLTRRRIRRFGRRSRSQQPMPGR